MERKHYIDNLRWICILLLIPFHCAMAYNSWGEGNYIVLGSSRVLSSFLCTIWPWFMSLLFLLAGISARHSLTKRSKKQFIAERVFKLFVPFVFGTLFIAPILSYMGDKINYGYEGNYFQHYIVFFTKLTDISGYDGGFTIAHFWFLFCLFIVGLIGCLFDLLLGKHIAKINTEKTPVWLLILLVLLAYAAYPLQVAGKCLLTYLLLYILGFYVFDKENNIARLAKFKWLFVIVCLILTALSVWLFIWTDYDLSTLNLILTLLAGAFGVLAMLSVGYSFMNKTNKTTRFLSSISFPIYIVHFVWVVAFEYWFSLANSNVAFVFVLSVLCSFLATLTTSAAIKYCPVLNVAFGYKLKRQTKTEIQFRGVVIDKYMAETPMLNYSEKSIQELIEKRKWKELDEFNRIKEIYNYVRDEIAFGYNIDDNIPATKVLSDGYGQCNTKGTLFMALLRACGIPCRVHGFTIDKKLQKGAMTGIVYKNAPDNILHSWVEILFEEKWYELEAFILDSRYLNSLQKIHSDCTGAFCGYGVAVCDFANPTIEWNRNNTYIQSEGINQDFGIYDCPDDLVKEHRQEMGLLKRFLYSHFGRHLMNKNIKKIRNTTTR